MKKMLAGVLIVFLVMLGGCAKAEKTNDPGQVKPSQKGTKLAAILEEYLILLERSDYMRSEEIMNYINRVTAVI